MVDRDVLICGICSTHFSDIKVFIEHKNVCAGLTTASSCSTLSCLSTIPTSTNSNILDSTSTQTRLSSGDATSFHTLTNLGVVAPHFLIPTTTSQVYQIVISPSSAVSTNHPAQSPQTSSDELDTLTPETSTISRSHIALEVPKTDAGAAESLISTESHKTCRYDATEVVLLRNSSESDSHLFVSEVSEGLGPLLSSSSGSNLPHPLLFTSNFDSRYEESPITSDKTKLSNSRDLSGAQVNNSGPQIPSNTTNIASSQNVSIISSPLKDILSNNDHFSLPNRLQRITFPVNDSTPRAIRSDESCETDLHSEGKNLTTFLATQLVSNIDSKLSASVDVNVGLCPANNIVATPVSKMTQPEKDSNGRLSCPHRACTFSTRFKRDLDRHVRKHTGEKPFSCSECSACFSRPDKLKSHRNVHSKERPFACSEPDCSYRAAERAHLRKHMRIHTNERPFKCEFCPYRAKDPSHLTVHLRTHTGDSPFYCQFEGCLATFKTTSDYRRHSKIHTRRKLLVCSHCNFSTVVNSKLKVHIESAHAHSSGPQGRGFRQNKKVLQVQSSSSAQTVREEELITSEASPAHNVLTGKVERCKSLKGDQIKHFIPSELSDNGAMRGERLKGKRGRRDGVEWVKSKLKTTRHFKCDMCSSTFVRLESFRAHSRHHKRGATINAAVENSLPTKAVLTDDYLVPNQSNDACQSNTRSSIPSYVITIDGVSSVYSACVDQSILDKDSEGIIASLGETYSTADRTEEVLTFDLNEDSSAVSNEEMK